MTSVRKPSVSDPNGTAAPSGLFLVPKANHAAPHPTPPAQTKMQELLSTLACALLRTFPPRRHSASNTDIYIFRNRS
jgi:hypothetical protein